LGLREACGPLGGSRRGVLVRDAQVLANDESLGVRFSHGVEYQPPREINLFRGILRHSRCDP
jgi:hypothetical protein